MSEKFGLIAEVNTDLLAAKSAPDKAKLLAGGVRLRLRGGTGVDHVKESRFKLN